MPGCRLGLRRSAPTYGKRYRIRGGAQRLCAIQIHVYFTLLLLYKSFTYLLTYLLIGCPAVRERATVENEGNVRELVEHYDTVLHDRFWTFFFFWGLTPSFVIIRSLKILGLPNTKLVSFMWPL